MASPTETPSWNNRGKCGCKGCAVARAEGYKMGREDAVKAMSQHLHYTELMILEACCHEAGRGDGEK